MYLYMGQSDKRKVGQYCELQTAIMEQSYDSDDFHFRFTPANEPYNKVVCNQLTRGTSIHLRVKYMSSLASNKKENILEVLCQ